MPCGGAVESWDLLKSCLVVLSSGRKCCVSEGFRCLVLGLVLSSASACVGGGGGGRWCRPLSWRTQAAFTSSVPRYPRTQASQRFGRDWHLLQVTSVCFYFVLLLFFCRLSVFVLFLSCCRYCLLLFIFHQDFVLLITFRFYRYIYNIDLLNNKSIYLSKI